MKFPILKCFGDTFCSENPGLESLLIKTKAQKLGLKECSPICYKKIWRESSEKKTRENGGE